MQVRALRSFNGRYGHIRVGQIFSSAPNYAQDLMRNGLVELLKEPGPEKDRAIPEAPKRAEEPPPVRPPPTEPPSGKDGATASSERAPASGKGRTSSSLRADLASRRKTRKASEAGATATPDPDAP